MKTLDIRLGETLKIGDVEIKFYGHRGGVYHISVKSDVEPVLLPKPPKQERPC